MITLIPMAGKGERFIKAGYTTPKPLISISGVPMVVKAALDLPKSEKYIFVVLEDHIKLQHIDETIKKYIPASTFVVLNEVTEGQASTCLLGLTQADMNDELLIGACDNGMVFNPEMFADAKKDADVLVFTFKNNVTVVDKPNQYGWVKVNDNENVVSVSVKVPISNNPIKDHAIIGAFWFKNANIFKLSAERMIANNRRINNEFYVDECINDAIALNYKVKVFEVDKYVCWGTPNDYLTYQYWESYFNEKM